jgi:hypothetical protein
MRIGGTHWRPTAWLSKVALRRLAAARAARMLCTVPCSHLRSSTDCCGYEQTDKFDTREWHPSEG